MGSSARMTSRRLPPPRLVGERSLEACLAARRSQREFSAEPIDDACLGQLLWAAQGALGSNGRRTAPSAGGLNGLEAYVARAEGFFSYDPHDHRLILKRAEDIRGGLSQAAGGQDFLAQAPVVILLIAVEGRIQRRYGRPRGTRYVILEAGHAAQNLLLQAAALDLAAVPVGAFDDAEVERLCGLPDGYAPMYLIPVGHPAVARA